MDSRTIGSLDVSTVGLGCNNFGWRIDEAASLDVVHAAFDAGVTHFDTADVYGDGASERFLGRALAGHRDEVVIATKFGNGTGGSPETVRRSVDASLQRLGIETIDLYQMHWPERKTNYFGRLGYNHQQGDEGVAIEETLAALGELVAEGKIRHVGLSNETPWGMMAFLRAAAQQGLPRMMSIQNPYNLLNRTFEIGCAEVAVRESMGLLAYSPLAMGTLAGKYLAGARPAQARLTLFPQFNRYMGAQAQAATAEYVQLAHSSGLKPAQMALAFVTSRPFVTSNLIGATTVEQLRQNLDSAKVVLSQEVLEAIEAIQRKYPNPAP